VGGLQKSIVGDKVVGVELADKFLQNTKAEFAQMSE